MKPPWKELADTLTLRRNLQAAQFPPEMIGTKGGSGNRWETPVQAAQTLADSRKRHRDFSKGLLDLHRIKNARQLERKIENIRETEEILWHECRPDLYPLIK